MTSLRGGSRLILANRTQRDPETLTAGEGDTLGSWKPNEDGRGDQEKGGGTQDREGRLRLPPQRYLEVDEDGGSQDPQALEEISQHMHKGSPDTGVSQGQRVSLPFLQRCILCAPRSMAVGGSSLVQHKGHSEGGERFSCMACSSSPAVPTSTCFPSQKDNTT